MAVPTIRVTPEILYSSSEDVSSIGGRISSAVSELSSALDGIRGAYEGQLEAAVGARVASAQGAGNGTANRIGELSADLVRRATAFQSADDAAMGAVLGATTISTDWRSSNPQIGFWATLVKLPIDLIRRLLGSLNLTGSLALVLPVGLIAPIGGMVWNGGTFLHIRLPWQKTDNLVSPTPSSLGVGITNSPISGGFGSLLDRENKIAVPYRSQWDYNAQQGRANCGPASLSMAIGKYGVQTTTDEVAAKVRDGSTGGTDFKSQNAKDLLNQHGLEEQDVNNMDSLASHLDKGQPVIILVDNKQYMRTQNGRSVPYPSGMGFEANHVVVATGYEKDAAGNIQSVFINDPLAVKMEGGKYIADPEGGTNFVVPIDAFNKAASNERWYGAAVVPKDNAGARL